jgi:WD40 repeat protein
VAGHIFISYSHHDHAYTARLTAYLRSLNITPWTDEGIEHGADWARTIEANIESCAGFVPIMSIHSRQATWVRNEILLAQRLSKPILPLLLSGTWFFELLNVQGEDVTDATMPPASFTTRLHTLVSAPTRKAPGTPSIASLDRVRPPARPRPSTPPPAKPAGTSSHASVRERLGRRPLIPATVGVATILAVIVLTLVLLPRHDQNTAVTNSPTSSPTNAAAVTALTAISASGGLVDSVAFSPNGKTMATAGTDGAALWNVSDPAQPQHLAALAPNAGQGLRGVNAVVFSPDGKTMATGDENSTVVMWNVSNPAQPRPLATVTVPSYNATSLAFSPDGKTMATGSGSGTVTMWNVSDPARPRILDNLDDHTSVVTSVAFRSDGKIMATGSGDETAIIWNVSDPAQPQRLAILNKFTYAIRSLAFSPDGKTMVTGGGNGTVTMSNVSNPARPRTLAALNNHTSEVASVAFSPDGKTMATGSDDFTAIVWNVSNPAQPRPLATLNKFPYPVKSVAFSSDGKTMATGNADGTVNMWRLNRIPPTP